MLRCDLDKSLQPASSTFALWRRRGRRWGTFEGESEAELQRRNDRIEPAWRHPWEQFSWIRIGRLIHSWNLLLLPFSVCLICCRKPECSQSTYAWLGMTIYWMMVRGKCTLGRPDHDSLLDTFNIMKGKKIFVVKKGSIIIWITGVLQCTSCYLA